MSNPYCKTKMPPGKRQTRLRFGVWLVCVWLLGCSAFVSPTHATDLQTDPQTDPQTETTVAPSVPTSPTAQPPWVEPFVVYIQDAIAQKHIPGLALALVSREQTLLVQGFGLRNVAAQEPVTPDTLFHIGSTHKSITAMLIAALVDDGVMAWDAPVASITDKFALSDPEATKTVTIRHLLSMRGGIPKSAEDTLADNVTPQDVFTAVAQAQLLGMPGQQYAYSNLSSAISGYLGVLAAGGSFDNLYAGYADLLQKEILTPIGMEKATIYASVAQSNPNHSLSYTIAADGTPVLTPSIDEDGDALAPSGSLKASAAEMALYVRTQLARGVAPNGIRVISETNLVEMWKPYLEDYAMGWERTTYQGMEILSHSGAYDNFVSVIGFLPDEDAGFVILINSEKAGDELVEDVPKALADILRRYRTRSVYLPLLNR